MQGQLSPLPAELAGCRASVLPPAEAPFEALQSRLNCVQALAGWGVCLLLVLGALYAVLMLIGAALLIVINDG